MRRPRLASQNCGGASALTSVLRRHRPRLKRPDLQLLYSSHSFLSLNQISLPLDQFLVMPHLSGVNGRILLYLGTGWVPVLWDRYILIDEGLRPQASRPF